jgi:hypothetical protein
MKRSEMLKLIEDVLFASEGAWPWEQNKLILDAIEKAGMLPPTTTQEEPGLIRNEWSEENWNE